MNKFDLENLGSLGEIIKTCIESTTKKVFAEMFEDYENNRKFQYSTISSDILCSRWGICKNTLRNYEKDGVITPLPTCGRTKMYSMNEVLDVEMNNPYFKSRA